MSRRDHMPSRGPSQRQLRVGELIRRTLSDVLMRGDLHDPELEGVSITVGEVQPSPDLRQARVHVMPLGGGDLEAVLEALNRNKGVLRKEITRDMTLKFSPELKFVADTTFDRMDETRRLLGEDRVRRDIET